MDCGLHVAPELSHREPTHPSKDMWPNQHARRVPPDVEKTCAGLGGEGSKLYWLPWEWCYYWSEVWNIYRPLDSRWRPDHLKISINNIVTVVLLNVVLFHNWKLSSWKCRKVILHLEKGWKIPPPQTSRHLCTSWREVTRDSEMFKRMGGRDRALLRRDFNAKKNGMYIWYKGCHPGFNYKNAEVSSGTSVNKGVAVRRLRGAGGGQGSAKQGSACRSGLGPPGREHLPLLASAERQGVENRGDGELTTERDGTLSQTPQNGGRVGDDLHASLPLRHDRFKGISLQSRHIKLKIWLYMTFLQYIHAYICTHMHTLWLFIILLFTICLLIYLLEIPCTVCMSSMKRQVSWSYGTNGSHWHGLKHVPILPRSTLCCGTICHRKTTSKRDEAWKLWIGKDQGGVLSTPFRDA